MGGPVVAPHRLRILFLAALATAACAGCGATTTSPGQGLGPNLATIFQDQAHILADPAGTLDTFRSLGVTDVRVSMGWSSLAPNPTSRTPPPGLNATSPTAYAASQWAPYDAAVRAAAARGIGIYLLLTGPAPLWATTPAPKGTATHNAGVYEPSATQFGDFVKAVGTRYSGQYTPPGSSSPLPAVKFWSIWDEPNYGYQLAPQAIGTVEVSPYLYRGLVDSAWSALHATGHGADTILIGETAPRGANIPGVANGMLPLRFLRNLYCVGASYHPLTGAAASARRCPTTAAASQQFRSQHPALFDASGFAAHLYTPGQVARPDLASPANEPDWAGLADLPSLEHTLDRLHTVYGASRQLPIFNTEFGFQTNPPVSTCGCVFLSPTSAAYYLNWAEYIEWRDRRVHSDAQYLLYDAPGPAGHTNESGFSSGLLLSNGTPKPSYAAFRLPLYLPVTSVPRGRPIMVWGYVRPAVYAARDTGSVPPVDIQFEPASHGPWTTVRTVTVSGSASAFDVSIRFGGSGSVRLRWSYPAGFAHLPPGTPRTITSRVQRITVH
ncbi:MAG TPA: hypothetical protein VG186_02365 [Solirubrobacteraceae bacterium]|nr:hypothetical protein [Solirubrobacteraceae bacterium]